MELVQATYYEADEESDKYGQGEADELVPNAHQLQFSVVDDGAEGPCEDGTHKRGDQHARNDGNGAVLHEADSSYRSANNTSRLQPWRDVLISRDARARAVAANLPSQDDQADEVESEFRTPLDALDDLRHRQAGPHHRQQELVPSGLPGLLSSEMDGLVSDRRLRLSRALHNDTSSNAPRIAARAFGMALSC